MKRIYLGADHAGYNLKEKIKKYLLENGFVTDDLGTYSEKSVDYPEFGVKVAKEVVKDKRSLGIIVCGTGVGISIAANKVKGARAANLSDEKTAALVHEHNDANILAFGARVITFPKAKKLIEAFLKAKPNKVARHKRRVKQLNKL
ncbi:MAG: ribose 5-phosphate isomerase B [Candidatus Diapherotrites archaeon CG11_big_fil_rev_8_21_14_0_20_37_9]|nr:MAG: ribose 5-phosphate isomerase B [Candidatus Diapherotrites archaeon CG11_big_fil_rev_8_21_14_0_20_37_9]